MPGETDELQRIWHSTISHWNAKRLRRRAGERLVWDAVILTAANETQARGYELEIARRKEIGMIDARTRTLIVPDRAGKRIGSGGATLWATKRYAEDALGDKAAPRKPRAQRPEDLFRGKRILMMHCGGEGRRVPSNAGTGKLFATLPFEALPGRSASAFDALYAFLCVCAGQMDEGMVVCSGDVLAVFDPESLHWDRSGLCGIGIPVPLELAARHGVYVPDATRRRVADYPQKPSPEAMWAMGAVIEGGRALVDGAGILRFSADLCASLARLAGVGVKGRSLTLAPGLLEDRRRAGEGIDLYTDIAWTLVPAMNEARYFAGLNPGKAFVRRELWRQLRGPVFHLDVIEQSLFVHLGNLWQILQAFERGGGEVRPGTSGDAAMVFGARGVLASHVTSALRVDPLAHIHNSFLDCTGGHVGPHALVTECELSGWVNVGTRAVLRGVRSAMDLDIYDEVAVFAIPLAGKGTRKGPAGKAAPMYACCVHGLEDNPKESLDAGAKFLGAPLSDWMREREISEKDLWNGAEPGGERSLWTARLHPVGGDEALSLALWMQDSRRNIDRVAEWRRAERISFAGLFERVDYQAGFQQRESLVWKSLLASIRRDLTERRDPRECLQAIGAVGEFIELREQLRQWIESTPDPLTVARMLAFEADLLAYRGFGAALRRAGGVDAVDAVYRDESRRMALSSQTADASLRKVAEAVAMGVSRTEPLDLAAPVAERVVMHSPARIDFGGGWTDTPPQCLERGGVILSAAITLNGGYPVRVIAEKIEERVVRIESGNARGAGVLATAADLPLYQRLDDPFGLVKAALAAVGFCAETGGAPLQDLLAQWGHGLRIYTEANVPKGSGLGTSSILGAAVIGCLRRMFGASLDVETIFRQVLYLEQLLTSGGGWQDQLGALVPGIKLATVPADSAFVLRPKVEPLQLSGDIREELNRRLVLFYVGKRRVAFNMLREIVVGYLSGNPDVVHALDAIYEIAFEMREALMAGDFDRFGALLTRTRMLYRLMCEGTTSDLFESLFAAASPYSSGGKSVGAGGGGFIMIMARSAEDARRTRERLKEFSWRGLGEFYDFAIDTRGLHEVVDS